MQKAVSCSPVYLSGPPCRPEVSPTHRCPDSQRLRWLEQRECNDLTDPSSPSNQHFVQCPEFQQMDLGKCLPEMHSLLERLNKIIHEDKQIQIFYNLSHSPKKTLHLLPMFFTFSNGIPKICNTFHVITQFGNAFKPMDSS